MKRKKFLCSGLVILVLMSGAVPVYAQGAEKVISNNSIVSPQFTAILSMSAGLSINSSGKATCSGSVTPSANTYTSKMTVSLQKSTSKGWSAINSWSGSGVGYAGVMIEANYYVANGTYRVCTTVNIYNSAGTLLETESFYSAEKTYQ